MRYGNLIVDQVNRDGEIIEGKDSIYSRKELKLLVDSCFEFVETLRIDGVSLNVYKYNDIRYAIMIKNVTYLGIPHPKYKKRIQITADLKKFYRTCVNNEIKPLLMGYYSGGGNDILVDYSIETYVNKKTHNSSAHVMVEDLQQATLYGYFQKVDYFNNTITVFQKEFIKDFLNEKFSSKEDDFVQLKMINRNASDGKNFEEDILPHIRTFYDEVNKEWNGIDCYKKMFDADYSKKRESEWPGYYFEFVFENYINDKKLVDIIQMYQDRTNGGIDLDLYFPTLDEFGDLKTHSTTSSAIIGNDKESFIKALEKGNVYYVVSELEVNRDIDFDSEVTIFWNTLLNKENKLSYKDRMKNSVKIVNAYVIEIKPTDIDKLSIFKQGVNSNGKTRKEKISISNTKLKDFEVYKITI